MRNMMHLAKGCAAAAILVSVALVTNDMLGRYAYDEEAAAVVGVSAGVIVSLCFVYWVHRAGRRRRVKAGLAGEERSSSWSNV